MMHTGGRPPEDVRRLSASDAKETGMMIPQKTLVFKLHNMKLTASDCDLVAVGTS